MCILFLKYSPDEGDYVLIAANNRDEVLDRPTSQSAFWSDHPKVLAGRDLLVPNGGTWFGVTVDGRFSVLTNYRMHSKDINPNAVSRGHLVSDYLIGFRSPLDYCRQIEGSKFNGFLLLTANLCGEGGLVYTSNQDPSTPRELGPGVYSLSNCLLDSPWQKVQRGKAVFTDIVNSPDSSLTDRLFKLLSDDTSYWPDPAIPDTGYSEERLKNTSAVFVNSCDTPQGRYATRIQTVLLVGRDGNASYTERTLSPESSDWNSITHTFQLVSK